MPQCRERFEQIEALLPGIANLIPESPEYNIDLDMPESPQENQDAMEPDELPGLGENIADNSDIGSEGNLEDELNGYEYGFEYVLILTLV